eukprot:SAG22_NODE_8881_length_624_cov_0.971429_2_plen_47_part_01
MVDFVVKNIVPAAKSLYYSAAPTHVSPPGALRLRDGRPSEPPPLSTN